LTGNQRPYHFLSHVAIDQTHNRNLDPKVRVERDLNKHRRQETPALKAAEREQKSGQNRETQPRPSATAIQMKLVEVIRIIDNRMGQEFRHRITID
jgi:hypothetical protein